MGENQTETVTDVTLTVEGKSIYSNRQFLAQHSDYFDAMFRSQMRESISDRIELKGVKFTDMQQLLDCICEHQMSLSVSRAISILPVAALYQFKDVMNRCKTVLLDNITPDNCLYLMTLGESCGILELCRKSMSYVLWYFEDLAQHDTFLELHLNLLTECLNAESLRVCSEMLVYAAVVKWRDYDVTTRSECFCDLVKCLKLGDLSDSQKKEILSDSHIRNCQVCQEFFNTEQLSKRKMPEKLLVVGGVLLYPDSKEPTPTVDVYDFETQALQSFVRVPDMGTGRQCALGFVAAVVGKCLYITGGEVQLGRNGYCYDVHCYDLLEGRWRIATRLLQPRRHHSVCVVGDDLYLLGGFGKHRVLLDSVEKLNTSTGEWEVMPGLSTPEYSAAVTQCQGQIYVIKHSVQCFNITQNQWSVLKVDLPFQNGFISAVTVGCKLYLTGQYAPDLIEFDTDSLSFTIIGKFKEATGSSCLIGNYIYIVGGEFSESVECYNLDSGHVDVVAKMTSCRVNHSCVVAPVFPK